MRVGLDTNVLAYSEGGDDESRQRIADEVMLALRPHSVVLPVQVSVELFHYLVRKKKLDRAAASAAVEGWHDAASARPATTEAVVRDALMLATNHRIQVFDAIILAASAEAGCQMLLSEDMQDGFVWRGVTIVNPFAGEPHPMLVDVMRR